MNTDEPKLRRKWTLRAHGKQVVFVKGRQERTAHVLMKAFLWALYLPAYPNMYVEIRIGDKYKPDVVAFAPPPGTREGKPLFWGESGQVGRNKIRSLARRYRDTHFAIAKWDTRLDPLIKIVSGAMEGVQRTAPFDLLNFAPDSARFIDDAGNVSLTFEDVAWVRL